MTPEGKVRSYLRKQAIAAGFEHRKLGWIGRKNAPDEFIFWPESKTPIAVFIEVKRENERPTEAQMREIERLRAAGFYVCVVDCKPQVDDLLCWATIAVEAKGDQE